MRLKGAQIKVKRMYLIELYCTKIRFGYYQRPDGAQINSDTLSIILMRLGYFMAPQ